MAEKNDFLPQNIKSLRRAFGESQEDLAFAIGLEAKTTISNYENGTRRPKPEVRKKLAKHFRITEEQLINVDLSGIRKTSFNKMNDIHRIQEIGFAAFPVVCSEAAMKNTSFANGYNAHKRINECLHSGVKPDDKDYDIFIESYYSAWEKNAIPEAAGNILSWFLQIEYSVLNPQLSEGAQRLMDNKI
ncbi:MAG: helix-turn-helix transcriptional regulator [Ruminococcus sp.]|nr:helix-turn-helix transcriptional regulator [Ruminococcus sp.]